MGMTMQWDDLALDMPPARPDPRPQSGLHCTCGRFAKWAGERSYYNGQFDCYSYTVHCSRCGDVTIECV